MDYLDVRQLKGPKVYTDDLNVSAYNLGSIMQRGSYTLAANVKFVTFPRPYASTTGLIVVCTPDTANQQFLQGLATSGFTVSGSGTDTGKWLAVGYQ